MILVDTSVLIDFLKGRVNTKVDLFDDALARRLPWGICEFVYQEVLQGALDDREFDRLKDYFDTVPVYPLRGGLKSFEQAARMNLACRRAGVTVRSTIDLVIARIAIENDLALLHNDAGFDRLAEVVRELRIYKAAV